MYCNRSDSRLQREYVIEVALPSINNVEGFENERAMRRRKGRDNLVVDRISSISKVGKLIPRKC